MNIYFVKFEFCSKIEKTTLQRCHKYFNFVEGSRGGLLLTPLLFLSVLPGDLLMEKKKTPQREKNDPSQNFIVITPSKKSEWHSFGPLKHILHIFYSK